MSPTLTIAAQGGLCNRLRVVLSALFFSEESKASVRVAWAKNEECFAEFDELFMPINTENFCVTTGSWWLTPVSRYNLHLPTLVRAPFFDAQQKNFDPRQHGSLKEWTQKYKRLYLSTGYALLTYPTAVAKRLQPVATLQQRIADIVSLFTSRTVGIHIRRTDNAISIAESPIEAFEQAIDAEIAADSSVRFFLATDESGLKEKLSNKYPGRIIFQQTTAGRNALAGMQEAVVDLFCLAATHKLLGSYWSSFTDTAAELGGMPTEIIHSNNATR